MHVSLIIAEVILKIGDSDICAPVVSQPGRSLSTPPPPPQPPSLPPAQ